MGSVMTIEEQIELLPKQKTRERVRRFLIHRGTLTEFAAAEGMRGSSAFQLVRRMSQLGGPLCGAIHRWRQLHGGITEADLTPCTACGLRGHVAGEPGRCSGLTTTGVGQSPWMAEGGW